jgi:hypothetical protein
MDTIKVDVGFRSISGWRDSEKRTEHVFDRMKDRGIGREQVIEAVKKGAKRVREDGSIISEFRWYKVIYREFRIGSIKKIYPITVFEV